ncbi:cytochrome b [Pararhodobacter marinus]|uniref:cytochrome b n=2 Tax=Pararhodobacter marinus TaxID=2184063 RepID=UPI003513C8EB
MSAPVERYARTQVILHWTTLALLLVSFISHEGMKSAWRAFTRDGVTEPVLGAQIHVAVGIAVLVLTLWRLALRVTRRGPKPVAGQPPMLTVASSIVHGLIYLVLLALPLSGMAAWFGGITDVGEVHEVLFTLGLVLVGLHVAAALFHQFVLKDRLLARMR